MNCGYRIVAVVVVLLLLGACGANKETTKQKLLTSGNEYYEQGRFREAAIMYNRALKQDRRFGEAYFQLGQAELKMGRVAQAARALHRAVELQPANVEAFTLLCEIYLSAIDVDPVRSDVYLQELHDLVERAEKVGTSAFQVHRVRGYVAMATEEPETAIKEFEAAKSLNPSDEKLDLPLVRALVAAGKPAEAEQLARDSLAKNPSFGPMYDRLYMVLLGRGDEAGAEALIRQKCEANPDQVEYQFQLAAHYHRVGKPNQRDQVLKQLREASEGDSALLETLAEFYETIQNSEEAVILYRQAAEAQPARKIEFELRAAEAMAAAGRGADALQVVEQILKDDPENRHAIALRAALRLYGGDRDSAKQAIFDMESIITDMPKNPVLRYNLGMAYVAIGDYDKALVQFQEASALQPNFQAPRFQLGRIYLIKQQPATAAQLADEVLKINPRSLRGRLLRAASSLQLREYNQARAYLTSVLKDDGNYADAQFLLASLNIAERNYKDAEKVLLKLYETSPQDSRGIRGLISLYVADGRPQEAQKLLDAELVKNPESRQLRLVSADIAMEAKDYARAIADYGTVLEQDPNQARIQVAIGMAQYYAGDFEKAELHLREARRIQPKNMTATLRLSVLVGELGRYDESRKLLEEVLAVAPDNAAALNNMAYILAQSNATLDTAQTLAEKAVSRAPNVATIKETLAWIYYKKNLSDQAIKLYQDVVTMAPKNPEWRYRYAQALYQKGERRQAKNELLAALENRPNRKEERLIRQLLQQIGL